MKNQKLNDLIKSAQGDRSQNQFALHCGVSSSAITHVLEGKNRPSPKFLKKIADKAYNGVTFEDLIKANVSPFISNDEQDNKINPTIGNHLKALREDCGYSLKQVEQYTGVDNGNLSRYERNLNYPSIELCIRLANLYGISLDELVGRSERNGNPIITHSPTAPALADDERKLLDYYGQMSHPQKIRVIAYCEGMLSTGQNVASKRNA